MRLAEFLIGAYLLGSVPFGVLIAAAHGIDLRKVGSGNIGATNLSRALGRRWAYLCFALDLAKGFLPTLAAGIWLGDIQGASGLLARLAVGCAAIAGHVFPVYLRFKGGKGVATSFGVALGFWPYYTICAGVALMIWVIFVLIWRYVSLASLAAAFAFPVILAAAIALIPGWRFSDLWPLLIVAMVIPFLVFLRHRDNVVRLLAGTESKILQKKSGQK
ncbi:MAG: glycerol-3-phosphate 1-O-acyltransferase PlsY [Sedimentisphaerales bacterium]|jgi:glycerol-3-phosphate acyltransferase PlsY